MSDPFDFDWGAERRRQEQSTALAQKAKKGLPSEQIVPGAVITLSTNKATGDRSYTNDIYRVIAMVGDTIIMRATGLCSRPWSDKPSQVQYHEHEFYAAEALVEALRAEGVEAQS